MFLIEFFKSINTISVDSSFIRNILGVNTDKNTFYNNNPGFKIHCLVDSHETMISFYMSSCNDGDSNHINSLFDNGGGALVNDYIFCYNASHMTHFLN